MVIWNPNQESAVSAAKSPRAVGELRVGALTPTDSVIKMFFWQEGQSLCLPLSLCCWASKRNVGLFFTRFLWQTCSFTFTDTASRAAGLSFNARAFHVGKNWYSSFHILSHYFEYILKGVVGKSCFNKIFPTPGLHGPSSTDCPMERHNRNQDGTWLLYSFFFLILLWFITGYWI